MSAHIRAEKTSDREAVYGVLATAFPTAAEARLVDVLRDSADGPVSLVATENQELVGHIMFTPVWLDSCAELRLMGLGPMAVSPSTQRAGIGSLLVEAGLKQCREAGAGAVVVLGHPGFYPRFGFEPSSRWGIKSEYDVPEEVFMVLELLPDYLAGYSGVIRYDPAFAKV